MPPKAHFVSSIVTRLCAGVILATSAVAPSSAQSVAEFYKGKSINLVVGFTNGGGYDVYARLIAPYLSKHLPGNPTLVVQNMPGAGSLKATNYLYRVAPKDGTVIGTIARGQAIEPLIGNAAADFDATKFHWLGSGTDEISICAVYDHDKIRTWEDGLKIPFTVAGEGSGADADIYSKIVRSLFGVKLRLVSGYPGAAEMTLAIERREVDGRCGWSWSTVRSIKPQWITENRLRVLALMSLHHSDQLPGVPSIMDFAKTNRQRQILTVIFSRQTMGRPFLAPPELPADRAAALRQAFEDATKDPTFIAEARARQMDVDPVSGTAIDALVGEIYRTPRAVLDEIKSIVASRN